MSDSNEKKGALFVCLGNICRSPIAEAVFTKLVNERNLADKWTVDSAGTGGWHVGSTPDKRAVQVLRTHDVPVNHRARQITTQDFYRFDYIFGMDNQNISDLKDMMPKDSKAVVELLGKYDPNKQTIIKDPYYDRGIDGFEQNYQQCLRSSQAFLDLHS